MAKKDRKWIFIALAVLILLPVIAFYVGAGPIDIAPSARDLPNAVKAYRAAGFPWEARDLAPNPPVADVDNAAPLLTQAIAFFDESKFQKTQEQIPKLLSAGDFGAVEKDLKPFDKAMQFASQAANRKAVDFHRDWDLGPVLTLPQYAYLKHLANVFCYRAEIAAAKGDIASADENLAKALKMGDFSGTDPILISPLVQIACQAMVCRAAAYCASRLDHNAAALGDLEAILRKGWVEADFPHALRGEAYMGITILRNFDQFGGLGGLRAMSNGDYDYQMPQIDPKKLQRTGLPSGMIASAFLDRHLRYWTEIANDAAKEKDPRKLGQEMEAVSERADKERPLSGLLDRILLPVFDQAGMVIIRERADHLTTLALVEALIVRANTGRMPRTISEIPGKWIDPFTGQPLKVKADENSIRIYSLGPSKRDFGGKTLAEAKGQDYNIAAVYPPLLESH